MKESQLHEILEETEMVTNLQKELFSLNAHEFIYACENGNGYENLNETISNKTNVVNFFKYS